MANCMIVHPEELSKKWIDRLADTGIGCIGIHPWGGKGAIDTLKDLLQRCQSRQFRDLIDYAHRRGLEVEYEIHAAGYLLPREWYAERPELFRINEKGERTPDWNFCVSNPEAMELFASRAGELAVALYGSSPRFHFWMDDDRDTACHCPACGGLSPSDQQMMAMNCAVQEIRRRIPGARLAYLAYLDCLPPPASVRPVEGIFLEYAPFAKHTAKGADAEERIRLEQETLAPLLDFFGRENSQVLEYWYDNSMFSGWKKPPKLLNLNEAAMVADIAAYRAMGFENISTFACFLGSDYEELYGEADILPFARALQQK